MLHVFETKINDLVEKLISTKKTAFEVESGVWLESKQNGWNIALKTNFQA